MNLMKEAAFIGGKWTQAMSSRCFDVHNPATEQRIGVVPDMDEQDARVAIQAAARAYESWRVLPARDRGGLLKKWAALMMANQEDLARLLTAEQGKPLSDARNEVAFAAAFVEWFAEEGRRVYGEVIPSSSADVRYIAIKEPVGVAAGITPWNLPCAMVTRKAAPALAAGCTMVLKPAEDTPFSALALAELASQAGIPPGVLNIITSSRANAAGIGAELSTSTEVAKLSFTGSTVVGKRLIAQCADTVKRVSMELGGNSPFIVLADADLDVAVRAAMFAKFRNAGQTCIAPNRFFVAEAVREPFIRKLADAMSSLVVGDGMRPGVGMGPLISEQALKKVQAHVADALAQGAHLLMGGKRREGAGYFFEPTLLSGIKASMLMTREETFGPVVGVATFASEEALLAQANATRLGLASYLFSTNPAAIHRISRALEAGIVGVNTGAIATEVAPFGGYKESGLGREGARQGIDEFIETKFICESFAA